MADEEAKAKAEKLAAAKKRVEQLKKQKAKKAGAKSESKKEEKAVTETPKEEKTTEGDAAEVEEPEREEASEEKKDDLSTEPIAAESPPPDLAATVTGISDDHKQRARQPSLSVQSKMRSESFKAGVGPLLPGAHFSTDGDTAPDIHRKQATRIEELEKENRRLTKESTEGEKRWRKAEEELEELRDTDGSRPASKAGFPGSEELEKLRAEIASLQRQNAQLQVHNSRSVRHGSSPSVSLNSISSDELQKQLDSKTSTIESMEVELSTLRAQLARTASGSSSEKEQITALEDKLARTQRSLDTSQSELTDLKKNLDRTTEKAVKEGSERTSAETKLKTLTREAEEAKAQTEELSRKVEALEKKVTTLTTLHKEHDARSQALKKEREKADKEASELRIKLGGLENDCLRLREEKERTKKRDAQGVDDDGIDELENEERQRLESKVRELEAEVSDLRRGIWKDKRTQIDSGDHSGVTSPGAKFQDIDLGGSSPTRRRSIVQGGRGGFGDYFANSLSAFTGQNNQQTDALLEDEMDFDEDAFRLAQEEAAKSRIERVKEIKRGLSNWKGWRLDIAETRRSGGEGTGEIFEV